MGVQRDKQVHISGATGFVGQAVIQRIKKESTYRSVGATRGQEQCSADGHSLVNLGDLSPHSDWSSALEGIDVVLHTAARTHVTSNAAHEAQDLFHRMNTETTINLARQSADVGVKRFVFLSSIKVNGELSDIGQPFSIEDTPNPQDAYGQSKLEAELGLFELGEKSGMEIVCIRPPLVYGPGVKANFLTMMHWLERGVILPLGLTNNKRSLVAIDNLVDLIITCLDHPAAANQAFLVSDDEDLSTSELLRRMGGALEKPVRLMPIPPVWLKWGAKLLGKGHIAQRLLGNLQVDISKTKDMLGWTPPVSVDDGLRKTAEWYLQTR